tara:strand:+ start:19886 stop:20344 length:459 start_codon:yes stop_codon:yes gene_type:complete
MSKCYIPELSIRTIRKSDNINILQETFNKNVINKKIICTIDGYYEVNEKDIIKYISVSKKNMIFENFIDNYTLLVSNSYYKKIGKVEFIPFEAKEINYSIETYDIPESNNKFILEYINNRVNDFYFKTKEKIIHNNIFLNNDVSLILKTLNV